MRDALIQIGLTLALALLAASALRADTMQLPIEVRQWYFNPDGSCVQLSIGMAGVWNNNPNAALLPWDSVYGPAERGGATPSRVTRYANARGLALYNVTGDAIWPWLEWAAATGRYAAVGADVRHMQTVYGRDRARGVWYVCDNRDPSRINTYTDAQFRRLCWLPGYWCVILYGDAPPSVPYYTDWWK